MRNRVVEARQHAVQSTGEPIDLGRIPVRYPVVQRVGLERFELARDAVDLRRCTSRDLPGHGSQDDEERRGAESQRETSTCQTLHLAVGTDADRDPSSAGDRVAYHSVQVAALAEELRSPKAVVAGRNR